MQRLRSLASASLISAAKSLSCMAGATSCDLVAEAEHVLLLQSSRTSKGTSIVLCFLLHARWLKSAADLVGSRTCTIVAVGGHRTPLAGTSRFLLSPSVPTRTDFSVQVRIFFNPFLYGFFQRYGFLDFSTDFFKKRPFVWVLLINSALLHIVWVWCDICCELCDDKYKKKNWYRYYRYFCYKVSIVSILFSCFFM